MKQDEAEKAIKQRVIQVLEACKISVNKLAVASNISPRTLNDQINGDSKISAASLLALADFRRDISAEWLLRGEGDMFKNEPERDDSERKTDLPYSNYENALLKEMAEQRSVFIEQLRTKDKQISSLLELLNK